MESLSRMFVVMSVILCVHVSNVFAAIMIDESWYEKLGRWEDALDAYETKQHARPDDTELMLGRMRYGMHTNVL